MKSLFILGILIHCLYLGVQAQSHRLDSYWYFELFTNGDTSVLSSSVLEFGPEEVTSYQLAENTNAPRYFSNGSLNGLNGSTYVSNQCVVLQNLRDSVLLNYIYENGRNTEACELGYDGFGVQLYLPLQDSQFVFASEQYAYVDGNSFNGIKVPGYAYFMFDDPRVGLAEVDTSFAFNTPDTLFAELSDAISHPDGGWWIVTRARYSNAYYATYLDAEGGIAAVVESPSYGPDSMIASFGPRMRFRPDGKAFAVGGHRDSILLYYFDRTTGVVTPWTSLAEPNLTRDTLPDRTTTDVEWSADGRYLYYAPVYGLYQYDTHAADIEASRYTLALTTIDSLPYYYYFRLERGPDCRIYSTSANSSNLLHVIDNPTYPGSKADFRIHFVDLVKRTQFGLPEFPNYHLWAKDRLANGYTTQIDTAVCDSTIRGFNEVSSTREVSKLEIPWRIYPSPTSPTSTLSIEVPPTLFRSFSLRCVDALGREVFQEEFRGEVMQVSLSQYGLSSGLYSFTLLSDGRVLGESQRVLVVGR